MIEKKEAITLPRIINNEEGLYTGDLRYYFKLAFAAAGANNPYHNFRHSMNTLCEGYQGAKYCSFPEIYGKDKFRAFLIALMLHDFGHSGQLGADMLEIMTALRLIEKNILEEDKPLLSYINDLVTCSAYPHQSTVLHLGAEILRDADSSQTLTDVWLQQIIFGLAQEQGITQYQCLKKQINYLRHLKFYSPWGKEILAKRVPEKIQEVRDYLEILSPL